MGFADLECSLSTTYAKGLPICVIWSKGVVISNMLKSTDDNQVCNHENLESRHDL